MHLSINYYYNYIFSLAQHVLPIFFDPALYYNMSSLLIVSSASNDDDDGDSD